MEIILYSPVDERFIENLAHRLEEVDPETCLTWHRSIKTLEGRLKQPRQDIGVILAYVPNLASLLEIIVLKDLLEGLPVVLLLNDPGHETVAATHTLRPRVILEVPVHLGAIVPVLRRIMTRWRKN